MTVGTRRAPPTEAGSEERAPGEAAGGVAAAPGAQESTAAEQPFRQLHILVPLALGNACGGWGQGGSVPLSPGVTAPSIPRHDLDRDPPSPDRSPTGEA